MKKIFLLCLAIFTLTISAYGIEVSDTQYQNYLTTMKSFSDNTNIKIENILKGIELINDEYVIISGDYLSNGKLGNFHVNQSNITDEKENLIIKRLETLEPLNQKVYDIYNPDVVFDKFELFIGAKPAYEAKEGLIVSIGFGNDQLIKERENNRILLKDSFRDLMTELLANYNSIKSKNEIKNKITFSFTVDRNGNIISKKLLRSAGCETDKEILATLDNKKVKPLPKEYKMAVFTLMPEFGAEEIVKEKTKNIIKDIPFTPNTVIKLELDKRGNILSSEVDEKYSQKQGVMNSNAILNNISKIGNFIEILKPTDRDNTTKYLLINNRHIGTAPIEKEDIIFTFYMRDLERIIKRNWNPPIKDKYKRAVMLITIGRDGKLLSVKTVKSSGEQDFDLMAKKAVELSQPFKPLPSDYIGNTIDVEFTFDMGTSNFFNNNQKQNTKQDKEPHYYDYLDQMKKMK